MNTTIIVIMILVFLLSLYHHISLKREKDLIFPTGKMINVDGHHIHVHAEGEKSDKPILVIMSGSGVPAPVYEYKVLYSKLAFEYRVVVVEKSGYGYSQVTDVSRDVGTLVNEIRTALKWANENGPYVLVPHSFSGIEALYWAQKYPDEIAAIIGLDMAVPEACISMNLSLTIIITKILNKLCYFGIFRIPMIKVSKKCNLSKAEEQQYYYLAYSKMFNKNVIQEAVDLANNAKEVIDLGNPKAPMLLFVTDGNGAGIDWRAIQHRFAEKGANIVVIDIDCDHKVHYHKSDYIVERSKEFIENNIINKMIKILE